MNKVLIIIFCLTVSVVFSQTTYYVDNSNGNDTNNGVSPAMAWKTINKVNDQSFVAGDRVFFKKGEIWKNQQLEVSGFSGSVSNPIIFGAYPASGSGKPIFSTIITHSHTWLNQGGNLWKAVNPPTHHPERIWVDGIELLRGNSMSELDGVDFLWLYDSDENGDFFLYSDVDPINKQIDYTNSNVDIIIEDANYITFSNLDVQGGWTSIFILDDVSNVLIEECNIGKNALAGIDINSTIAFAPNNIKIENNLFDANFTLDYSMAGTYRGSDDRGCSDGIFMQSATDSQINNNYFKNWGHSSINVDGNPFGGTTVKISNIKVNDNFMTSPDIIYGGRLAVDDAFNCEVYNNQIIHTSVQTQLDGFDNHFHHNIIDGTTNPTIVENSNEISAGVSVETYSSTDVYNNIYEHNLIKNTKGAGFRFTNSGFFDIHDNIIKNNIIFNCGTVENETNIGIKIEEDTSDCETFNNIFSNNLIFNENSINTVDFRGTIIDVAGFNGLTGTSNYQITSNISGNPLFVNNNSDYHLTVNSPCINTGAATILTQDFEGNPLPFDSTLPDIGLYEYQAALSVDAFLNENELRVYPNPVANKINILTNDNIEVSEIIIYDISGKIIKKTPYKNKSISLLNLSSGLYFLEVKTNDNVLITKIIKL